jgi:hypothetical protein
LPTGKYLNPVDGSYKAGKLGSWEAGRLGSREAIRLGSLKDWILFDLPASKLPGFQASSLLTQIEREKLNHRNRIVETLQCQKNYQVFLHR